MERDVRWEEGIDTSDRQELQWQKCQEEEQSLT